MRRKSSRKKKGKEKKIEEGKFSAGALKQKRARMYAEQKDNQSG